jgi:uncharacterized protein (TIGR01244 family)
MSQLPIRPVSPDVYVAPQLTPDAMAVAAAEGFKSVINNRPDFEHGPDQPTSAAIESAAQAAGLQYVHQPVAGGYQSPEEIAEFARLLRALPHPVLVFCRTGTRSTRMFMAAQSL